MGAAWYGRDNRVFHYAVLSSVAFHLFVLFGAPALKETSSRMTWPGPIVARLMEPPAPAPRVEEPKPAESKPAAKPAVQPTVKPVPLPKPAPVVKAAPEAPSKPVPETAAAPAPAAEPPATPAPPSAASGAAVPQAAPAAAAPVDTDSVGRFRMQVIEEARKLKRYPRAARDNNWEGRTRLRVTYGGDGRRSSIDVVRSSGHELLDREAIDTLGRTDVPLPPALRGRGFTFEIEMIFNLSESASG